MKKYNIEVFNSGKIESSAKTDLEKKIIKILVSFGDSIDPQGSSSGDYDKAINSLIRLFKTL